MSLLRLFLISFGVIGLLALVGCRTAPTTLQPAPPPTSTSSGPVTTPADSPEMVVTKYVEALQEAKYATAYELLSKSSQSKHSRANFEELGKRGMPSYDLKTVKLESSDSQSALVGVTQLEDPATDPFQLVLEEGQWKVVYQGGKPGAPTE